MTWLPRSLKLIGRTTFRKHIIYYRLKTTNSRDAHASLRYFDGCLRCDGCPSTSVVHNTHQWRHRLACPFFNVDLSRFQFSFAATTIHCSSVPCNMIFGSASGRHTWPNHANWRCLTIDSKSSWCPAYWPAAIHICSLNVLCMICQALSFRICFQRLGFAFPYLQASNENLG